MLGLCCASEERSIVFASAFLLAECAEVSTFNARPMNIKSPAGISKSCNAKWQSTLFLLSAGSRHYMCVRPRMRVQ